jgi:hypothetical protein
VSVDPRVAAAERALAEHGVSGAMVEVEGHEREIAALRVPEGEWERMMGPDGVLLADAVKAAGFRYVALDLLTADAEDADEDRFDDDDEGPAGWDAFDPPDDAMPREVYPPLSDAERRAAFRALACLLLGLTAVEVVRAAGSPGTPWLPVPGVALQVGMSALAGYASTRHLRQRFSLPFAIAGTCVAALAASDAISAHDRVITPNQIGLHAVPLIAAALTGGLLGMRTRRAAAVVT